MPPWPFALCNAGYAAFLCELELDFRDGILAPDLRASLSPMAIACLRLLTLRRPPDLSSPCLYSCITFFIFRFAFGPYLRPLDLRCELRELAARRERVLRLRDDFDDDDERRWLRLDELRREREDFR